jgi:hypothetical protein
MNAHNTIQLVDMAVERAKPYNQANLKFWHQEYERLQTQLKQSDPAYNTLLELATLRRNAQAFLQSLRKNPRELVKNLCQNINKMIDSFDAKYSSIKSETTIMLLQELRLFADFNRVQNEIVQNSDVNYQYRIAYLVLCGSLHTTKEKLQVIFTENKVSELSVKITELISATHIDFLKNLPDELRFRESSMNIFRDERQEILDKLRVEFNTANNALKDRLAYYDNGPRNDLSKPMRDLIKVIYSTLSDQFEKNKKTFDMQFAISVLNGTTDLIDPCPVDSAQAQINYSDLANRAPGMPNVGKQLKGLMLGLLAISIITTGVVIGMASVGVATPVSSYLISSGFYVLAMATGGLLAFGGAYGLAKSVGLFKQGQRAGLSKDMTDLVQSFKKTPMVRAG